MSISLDGSEESHPQANKSNLLEANEIYAMHHENESPTSGQLPSTTTTNERGGIASTAEICIIEQQTQHHLDDQMMMFDPEFISQTPTNLKTNIGLDNKIRRSTRDIRRPKFDDELVESVKISKITPKKRQNEEDGRSARKKMRMTAQGDSEPEMVYSVQPDSSHEQDDMPLHSVDSDKFGDDESVARLKQVHREVHPFDASKIRSKKAQKLHLQNFDLEHIHPGNLEETSASHQSISRVGNVPNNANEIVRRWNSAEDDLSLIAAVGWVSDLSAIHNLMKFSKKYSLVEIEERWYELLYDENASKEAKKKMNSLSREKVRSLLSKIPFSSEEDKLIRSIPSNTSQQQMSILMEDMLIRQSETFHHARTLKILEEHWRSLKLHKTLVDQKPPAAPIPESLLEIEKTLDLYSLIEDDPVNQMTLDMEEKNLTRRIRLCERESKEWECVLSKAITGISSSPSMAQDTMAILRGHCIEFDIRRDKTIIGRSTSRHQVDINLSLEGPAARISRKQALLRLYENGSSIIQNIGEGPIFVDGKILNRGSRSRLQENSLIVIALITLHFSRNENYVKRKPEMILPLLSAYHPDQERS